jgi:hypothetical protein
MLASRSRPPRWAPGALAHDIPAGVRTTAFVKPPDRRVSPTGALAAE